MNDPRRRIRAERLWRDAGVERLRRATRLVTVGAVGLTGILSAGVALALPGHAKGAAATSGTVTGSPSSAQVPTDANAPSGNGPGPGAGVQPAAQAPTSVAAPPTTAPAPVVSGSS